jgi:hypothetical protein
MYSMMYLLCTGVLLPHVLTAADCPVHPDCVIGATVVPNQVSIASCLAAVSSHSVI